MNQLSKYPHLKWYVSNLRSIPGGSYRFRAISLAKVSGTRITMSPFRIGATPVTWGMWKEYRQSLSVPGKGVKLPKDPGWGYLDDHPVVNVSWADIMQAGGFCDWASSKAGFKLTLPSDAQWEYAARGGVDGLTYPWGDDFDESKLWCGARRTAPVDRTNKIYRNHYGLTDIVGNVTQWCSDPYNVDYRPVGRDPKDMNENDKFCVRGGGYNNRKTDGVLQNDFRDGYPFDFKGEAFGFRLSAGEK